MRSKELLILLGLGAAALVVALFVSTRESAADAAAGSVRDVRSVTGPVRERLEVANAAELERSSSPEGAPLDAAATTRVSLSPEREARSAFRLRGYVRDADTGAPLAGAAVVLTDVPLQGAASGEAAERLEARSDARGFYEVRDVTAGIKELACHLAGRGSMTIRYLSFAAGEAPVQERELLLGPGSSIAGRVVAPDGSGVADVRIDALSFQDGRLGRGSAVSGGDGRFVLEDLIEGGYMLKAQAGAWTVETVVDVPTGTPDLVLHAAPRGAIFGRVIVADTRAPVSEFRLIVRDAHPTHPELGEELSRSELEGRADGSFRIEGLAAGRYVVEASATGFASSFSDPVEVEWGGSARVGDVALGRGATLLGHVVDAYTKEPVVGAEVATHENHWTEANAALFGALFNSALTKTTVTTDRDGRFSVDHMTPGDYQVRVRCAGYFDVVWNDVTLHQGVVTDVRRLELQRGGSIAGVVLAADGSAAPGVDLSLRNVEGNVHFARLRSDASGRFELGTCAPGIYALWADPLPEAPPDKPRAEARVAVVDRGEHAVELHLLDAAPSGSSSSY